MTVMLGDLDLPDFAHEPVPAALIESVRNEDGHQYWTDPMGRRWMRQSAGHDEPRSPWVEVAL